MQATIRLLSERKGENFFLTSPLIGLIDPGAMRITSEKRVFYEQVTGVKVVFPRKS
jgi:hypothetical protein